MVSDYIGTNNTIGMYNGDPAYSWGGIYSAHGHLGNHWAYWNVAT